MNPPWVDEAYTHIGLKEGPGASDNPLVVAMFAAIGHHEIKHDSTAWCAVFVGYVLHESGLKMALDAHGKGTMWALDYAKWGKRIPRPLVGAIATKKRPGGGHTTIVVGYDNRYVYCLGGNQSDSVCIAKYRIGEMNSFSWPSEVPLPSNPPAIVKPRSPTPIVVGKKES